MVDFNANNVYTMTKKEPWHSTKSDIYHNDTNCNTGNNIEMKIGPKVKVATASAKNANRGVHTTISASLAPGYLEKATH